MAEVLNRTNYCRGQESGLLLQRQVHRDECRAEAQRGRAAGRHHQADPPQASEDRAAGTQGNLLLYITIQYSSLYLGVSKGTGIEKHLFKTCRVGANADDARFFVFKYIFLESCGDRQLFLTAHPQDGAGDSQQGGRKHLAISCFVKRKP